MSGPASSRAATPRTAVVVGPRSVLGGEGSELRLVSLRHPVSRKQALFAVSASEGLMEVQRCRRPVGSWLLGDRVLEDGSVMVLSPFDPLFLALPSLDAEEHRTRFCAARDLVPNDLLAVCPPEVVRQLCDTCEVGGEEFVRISEAKVVAWLCARARAAMQAVKEHAPQLATSGSWALGEAAGRALSQEQLARAGVGLLSECVEEKWISPVARELGLGQDFKVGKASVASAGAEAGGGPGKRKVWEEYGGAHVSSPSVAQPSAKRAKTSTNGTSSASGGSVAKKAVSEKGRREANKKRDAKAAQGSKSLASFFSKPPPAETPQKGQQEGQKHTSNPK